MIHEILYSTRIHFHIYVYHKRIWFSLFDTVLYQCICKHNFLFAKVQT